MKTPIYITESDSTKLTNLMDGMTPARRQARKWLHLLQQELDRAHVVDSHEIPRDVITLHSKVCLRDLDSGRRVVYELMLPSEAQGAENQLSILAPIGIAILGYREGDAFTCETPGGVRRFLVEEVLFQPEAAFLQGGAHSRRSR